MLTKTRPVSRMPLRVGSWPGPSSNHNSMIPILCGALQRRGATVVDVLHPWRISPKEIDLLQIHWPEQVFWRGGSRLKKLARVGLTLVALARLRCAGVRVTWMVHNVQPHDSGTLTSSHLAFLHPWTKDVNKAIHCSESDDTGCCEATPSAVAQSHRYIAFDTPLIPVVLQRRLPARISAFLQIYAFMSSLVRYAPTKVLMSFSMPLEHWQIRTRA